MIQGVIQQLIDGQDLDRGAARGTMDQTEHSKIFAEVGQLIYDNVQAVPLLWVPNAVIYNPEIISGWAFPGSMINAYSHWDNIKAAG